MYIVYSSNQLILTLRENILITLFVSKNSKNYCLSCNKVHSILDYKNINKQTNENDNSSLINKKELLNSINSLTKELHKRIVLDNGDR